MSEVCDPVSWADRGWYLALEFQQSSSAAFDDALSIAAGHPGFAILIDESGTCVYRTLYRAHQLRPLSRLLHLVAGWKNTRVYISGQVADPEAVETWLACYVVYSRLRPAPCREPPDLTDPATPVGCRFAGISLATSDWDGWYRQGFVDEQRVFHLDREALRQRVRSWERSYAACPYADAEVLRRVVESLPDRIIPRTDRCWRLVYEPYTGQLKVAPRSEAQYLDFLRKRVAPALRQR
ncbi:MAG: hypothetical protein HY321_00930 [Armatimonadetes bacterium]|nr:hypothetical protein [Armatimonadota bacterium]